MGDIVQLAEVRARRAQARGDGRGAADTPMPLPCGFEAIEYGSGWYHGEAIRTSRKPAEPR